MGIISRRFVVLGGTVFLLCSAIKLPTANAVSQWTRKFDVSCQTCHTAFPRLNYFGEQFARNGYQWPDTADAEDRMAKVNERTFVQKVSDMFGFRISFTPVEVTTKAQTINGGSWLRYNFGVGNWLQLFTAGTIFKNASIFTEFEIAGQNGQTYSAGGVPHINWFTLGYHNLFKTSWLNIRTGNLSMRNWVAQSGRLRMIPNINVSATRIRPSEGAAAATAAPEDQIRLGDPVPSIEVYGYKKFFLYSVGISNGARIADANRNKNFFGTLRFEVPKGNFAGSAITGWGVWGKDTANSATAQARNTFYATSGGVNVRWKAWDLIGEYVFQKEKNYDLATNLQNKRHAITGQLGYLIHPKWFAAAQYDWVKDSQNSNNEANKVSQHITYMPRENMRIGLTAREDFASPTNGKQHEFLLNVRAMF